MTRFVAILFLAVGAVACATGETTNGGGGDDDDEAGGAGGAGGGGGGGGGGAVQAYAHVVVTGDGMDADLTWVVPANHVSCVGDRALAMHFSADPMGGDGGQYVDVDVFGYSGPAEYESVTCSGAGCPPAPPGTFSVWYHPNGGQSPIYVNDGGSSPCSLTVTEPEAGVLAGSWVCNTMANVFGTGMPIDLTGEFVCVQPP